LQWAAEAKIPVRFMDLPESHQFALQRASEEEARKKTEDQPGEAEPAPVAEVEPETGDTASLAPVAPGAPPEPTWRSDPLALLAEAAGYKDHELWWEDQIERRTDAAGLFAAILEAMRVVRGEVPEIRKRDLLREAWMRKTLRAVAREGFEKVAVVCGAWHA